MHRYPHILTATSVTAGILDENGDWQQAESEQIEIGMCREEPNGAGHIITVADGSQYVFASKVYLPLSVKIGVLKVGADVKVVEADENVRCVGVIKRINTNRMHHVLWL